ncbi:MAG: NBR1-Ig-like domain-containing protein [Candidatus Uhrbacteria bacterium]
MASIFSRALRAGRITAGLMVCLSLVIPFGDLSPALAATTAYDASIIALDAPQRIAPGQTATIKVTVQNIGSAGWVNTGAHYVSIYGYDFTRRVEVNSPLASPGWESPMRPVRLPVSSLAPNKQTVFSFPIKASTKPGTYKGDFLLVVEGLKRMGNGRFTVSYTVDGNAISVSAPTATLTSAPAPAVDPVLAPGSTAWQAQLISTGGDERQMEMETNIIATLEYKNVGSQTWKRDSGTFVSLYSVSGNKERVSSFKDASWTGNQAAKMVETEVKPGQLAHFKVELRAPRSPAMYREEFMLAAENAAWITASRAILAINVPITSGFIASAAPGMSAADIVSQSASTRSGQYIASLLLRSLQTMTGTGNARQQVTVGFKNTGDVTWGTRLLKVKGVVPALTGSLASVRDDTWLDMGTPTQAKDAVAPGEVGFLTFYIKAPVKKGNYTASFQLYADNQAVDGGVIDIPITVTADGYIEPEPVVKPTVSVSTPSAPASPTFTLNPQPLNGDVASLPAEPMIRAGIFATTDNTMVIAARFVPLEVRVGGSTGNLVCSVAKGQSVTVSFDPNSKQYSLSGACSGQSATWYVVRATDGISPMEMSDFSRLVGWLPGANDNTFRGQMELRLAESSGEVWVINELPVEWYLKGIGETSNSSPQQYQRTLLVAARTYAMYHVGRGTKHAAQHYTVDATYDQVYRGYGAELRDPAVVQAVDATRGQIVTYQGKLAITPYFSRSDGRTRDWKEVWGGAGYPWLVSVPVPDDIGRTLWGHGVGMSAMGALQMDAKWGKTYDQILAHFYTGTELRRVYK